MIAIWAAPNSLVLVPGAKYVEVVGPTCHAELYNTAMAATT